MSRNGTELCERWVPYSVPVSLLEVLEVLVFDTGSPGTCIFTLFSSEILTMLEEDTLVLGSDSLWSLL